MRILSSQHRPPFHRGLFIGKAVHHGHGQQDEHHQHQRQRRAEVEVDGGAGKVALDGVADELEAPAAQLLGDVEGAHRGHEYHGDTGDDAGERQRHDDPGHHLGVAAAQVFCRFDQLRI